MSKESTEDCTPMTCWSGRSWPFILLSVFNLLMILVVVILLFVVDLSTNQIADTVLLAIVFIFQGVMWWMACPCNATEVRKGVCGIAGTCDRWAP